MENTKDIFNYPLLPLRDVVIFPYMIVPLFIGRSKSVKALEEAMIGDRKVVVAAQKFAGVEDPGRDDVYPVGCVAEVLNMLKLPDGTIKVLIEGTERVKILEYLVEDAYFVVKVREVREEDRKDVKMEALMRDVLNKFDRYVNLTRTLPPEAYTSASSIEDPGRLADLITSQLVLKVSEKQKLLEAFSPRKRLQDLSEILDHELEVLDIQRKIQSQVKKQIEQTQKEYYLKEQLKAIHKELGEDDDKGEEVEELRAAIKKAKMPKHAEEKVLAELKRLSRMPHGSAETVVVRNYIDWTLSLPWCKKSRETMSLDKVQKILDEDHFGLEKVKERIVEYLAVRKLRGEGSGAILCLVGPPGVGKTSLGRSVARALNRQFVRASLGGIRDEAEIRGHRRTYVGSMPGRILQSMKKAKTVNPVFLLDEIDKLSHDFRGDPSAALLEALDPEMNCEFSDHYLEIPYDLSEVMFIATANTMHPVPAPLQDRMEIITLPGYTELEKESIARQFLIPKEIKKSGLVVRKPKFEDEALKLIIRRYTRESGVRNLERNIGSICRKVAVEIVRNHRKSIGKKYVIDQKKTVEYLGPYKHRYGEISKVDEVGIATGLAWTPSGGEILNIEATLMNGKGVLSLTGQLGDVMKESAQAAVSHIRSVSEGLGLPKDFYQKTDIHIHVPEGGIPKDGPSAGVALATALVSALCAIEVDRNVAMTGEITLRGKVLPVGGIKEKLLAAHRAGIRRILMPTENEKDLKDINEEVLKDLSIRFVDQVEEVWRHALKRPPANLSADGKSKKTQGKKTRE